jgi:3-hydroxybutyryl-CoA dehydrogenase
VRILSEGIAAPQDVDRVMRQAGGFRMGPFQLMDLTGMDVNFPAGRAIYEQYFQEPRFRPFVVHKQLLDAGHYGRKTGRGWYDYADGREPEPPEAPIPAERPGKVWVSHAEPDGAAAVMKLLDALGADIDIGAHPPAGAVAIVTPLGQDCTTAAVEQGLDPRRTVAIDTCLPLDARITLMGNPLTDPAVLTAMRGLLGSAGTPVTAIKDSAGFIAQRILAHIINIGCDAAQQRVASPQDIDTAVTLGLNYPYGPLAYGDRLGPKRVLTILRNMQAFYGDMRYRPSPWLTRRALLGVSLLTVE